MVALRSSAATAAENATTSTSTDGEGDAGRMRVDAKTGMDDQRMRSDAKNNTSLDDSRTVTLPTTAEKKLLDRAESVAAEFDVSIEQLDACVAEFVREMGAYFFVIAYASLVLSVINWPIYSSLILKKIDMGMSCRSIGIRSRS